MEHQVTAVVVCAGAASRMGGIDKIMAPVGGVPAVLRTLRAFASCACVTEIVAVTRREKTESLRQFCKTLPLPVIVVEGGDLRAESVLCGVRAAHNDFVAIADGARPLIRPEEIEATCNAAFVNGAAALGVPVTDTVKSVNDDSIITGTVDRRRLWRVQTPQVFRRAEYLALAERALREGGEFTDDCSVYEHFGLPVTMVAGRNDNIKITVAEDLEMCNALCRPGVRVGHGYDVHRLVKDRALWLCGEKIEYEYGLLGHSDADVALHALIDAMLGAAALGDIGALFPDTDERYRGISSMLLLKEAARRVVEKFSVVNCDITVIAQQPKLMPYLPRMRRNIADALGLPLDAVNVKATTEEKLGFTGALEGISAHAVCALTSK